MITKLILNIGLKTSWGEGLHTLSKCCSSIHIFEIVHDFLYECHLAKEFLHVAQHNCAQLVLHLLVSVDQAVYILFVSASVIELSHL